MATSRQIPALRAKLNLAPLGGVVLVISMVVLSWPPPPRLPRTWDESKPWRYVAQIDRDGNLWAEKTKLGPVDRSTLQRLDAHVHAAWSTPDYRPNEIYVKGHARLSYAQVQPVVEYLHRTMKVPVIDLALVKGDD